MYVSVPLHKIVIITNALRTLFPQCTSFRYRLPMLIHLEEKKLKFSNSKMSKLHGHSLLGRLILQFISLQVCRFSPFSISVGFCANGARAAAISVEKLLRSKRRRWKWSGWLARMLVALARSHDVCWGVLARPGLGLLQRTLHGAAGLRALRCHLTSGSLLRRSLWTESRGKPPASSLSLTPW